METDNKKLNLRSLKKNCFFNLFVLFFLTSTPAFSNSLPIIFDYFPKSIQQGEATDITISGSNLSFPIVGISGGDIFAVILKKDDANKKIIVRLAANPEAEPGERSLILKNIDQSEIKLPFTVTSKSSPIVDSVYPNIFSPGKRFNTYIYGKLLTGSIVSTPSSDINIDYYQPSGNGSFIYISGTISENAPPGSYLLYVTNAGGQAQTSFNISSSESSDSFNLDPYSPGLFSIEASPTNKTQIVLKGSMFENRASENTVTLFENKDGTLVGQQLEILSANANEIVVNIPDTIKSGSIVISNSDGKASNIKPFNFDIYESPVTAQKPSTDNKDTKEETPTDTSHVATSEIRTPTNTQAPTQTNNSNAQPTQNNSNSTQPTNSDISHEIANKPMEPPKTVNTPHIEKPLEITEDLIASQNLKNINQYLFSNQNSNSINPITTLTLSEAANPEKLLTSIEKDKIMKNQAELIMLAIDKAKNNEELSDNVKKIETLKVKVEELEKVIEQEKQKDNPNQRKLIKYQQLLASANAESKSQTFTLLNNLLKYKPQLKNHLIQKPFDLAAIQPNIPPNAAIIQYIPTDEGLIIFVVDNKNLKTRINKSITKDILSKNVQEYRSLFEKEIEKIKTTGRVTSIASWKDDKSISYKKDILPLKQKNVYLYNILIKPIEKDIANKETLAFITNGWLRYLPFQSLGKLTPDNDLDFLISNKSIVYLDSVVALNNKALSKPSKSSTVSILANPDNSLPGATKEAELITKLFGKSSLAYVQQPFNISLINKFSKSDILHLATHGYLDSVDINSSFLVIGKKSEKVKKDKLFLKDIYDLNLTNSKLVVLSGCDTGKIGNLANEPDDIVGSLASAFRVAGANTILASLWKAHDDATKIIMQNFYENIKSGFNKADALRKAELKLKENPKYGHPLFWSLFSLIGDWR